MANIEPISSERQSRGNHAFAGSLFRSTVSREPTSIELSTIIALIASSDRTNAARSVLYSEESIARIVQELYGKYVGRMANLAEERAASAAVRSGFPLDKLIARLLESDEYLNRARGRCPAFADDSAFAQALYADLFQRDARPLEMASAIHKLHNAGRGAFALTLLRSEEFRAAFVSQLYSRFLQRLPSMAEIQSWTSWGNSSVDLLQIHVQVIACDEYFARGK